MMISSLKLSLLPLIFILLLRFSNSASIYRDTITPNQPIEDGDTLVSSGHDFALGFFTPNNSSRRRYVGIWFNKVSVQTVVWVANRDNPVLDGSGVLSVTHQGNLVLLAQNDTVWSSNVSSTTNQPTAQLLDSGNLQVLAQNGVVIWQSFDYPTDTILPPMKLGFDRRTGLNRVSRSWKSRDDPGQGTYSHAIDPTAVPQAFMYKGTDPYWRIGSWTGRKWTGVPELDSSTVSNITFVDNPDEVYITQGLIDKLVIVKLVINTSGSLQQSAWYEPSRQWLPLWYGPKELCDHYNQCGAHSVCNMTGTTKFQCECLSGFELRTSSQQRELRNGLGGCVRSEGVSICDGGDNFVKVTRVKLPDTKYARVNKGSSLEACGRECKRNCSCKAYANVDDQREIGCITWDGDLMDIRKYPNSGQDLYVRTGSTTLGTGKVTHSQHWKWMLPVFISITVLLAMAITFVYCRVTRTTKGNQRKMKYSFSKFREGGSNAADLPVFFDLSTIVAATDNFSFLNKLGQGGFGPVYKGRLLDDGKDIAVKRLSKNSGQGEDEFRNEVSLIAKLQHRNLVKILGCCIQEDENMLIYEYLPNKSLDFFLFDETKRALLDWPKRFGIVNGVARGMLYLHEDSRLRIIHRDLKASNVLLDEAMNPKISDFGMARIFGGDQIEGNTKRVVGTYGYMSPEYAMEGLFSIKSDVYSFGILLLEIVTGKRNSGHYHAQGRTLSLIGLVWELWTKGKELEIVDETMEEEYDNDEVLRCIQIGLLCVQEFAAERPTSSGVVFMLGNNDTGYQLPSPSQPAFTCKTSDQNGVADQGACSATSLTISLVEPR